MTADDWGWLGCYCRIALRKMVWPLLRLPLTGQSQPGNPALRRQLPEQEVLGEQIAAVEGQATRRREGAGRLFFVMSAGIKRSSQARPRRPRLRSPRNHR